MQVDARDCFQAAAGQLEHIGKGGVFASRANASISIGSQSSCLRTMKIHATASCCSPGGIGKTLDLLFVLLALFASKKSKNQNA